MADKTGFTAGEQHVPDHALENLVGCDIHSADRVVPAWQDVAVGDEVGSPPRWPSRSIRFPRR